MFKITKILDDIRQWSRDFRLVEIEVKDIDVPVPVYVDNATDYVVGDYVDAKKIDTTVIYDKEEGKRNIFPRLMETSKSSSTELTELRPVVYGAIQKRKNVPDEIMHVGPNGRPFYRAYVCARGWNDVYYSVPTFAYGKMAKALYGLGAGDKATFTMKLFTDKRSGFAYRVESIE